MALGIFRDTGVGARIAVGLSAYALVACGGALQHSPGPALGVPNDGPLGGDIAAGYREYGSMLERWGRWSDDALYGEHWCPRGVDPARFVPYQSNGHWGAPETASSGARGPAGSPFWLSDDAATWGDVTMHHGWWVHLDQRTPVGQWCWIPGAEETAARVVWRVAEGFVAWAPEPPVFDDTEDDSDADRLAWSYELLGTLLDDVIDQALLTGDAARTADRATWGARRTGKHAGSPNRPGPTSAQVAQARHALTDYVVAHPVVSVQVDVPSKRSASGPTTSTSTPTAFATSPATPASPSTSHSATTEQSLPSSMAIYDEMTHESFEGAYGYVPSPFLPLVPVRAGLHTGVVAAASSSESRGTASTATSTSHSKSHHGSSGSGHSTSSGKSSSSHSR